MGKGQRIKKREAGVSKVNSLLHSFPEEASKERNAI